MKNVLHFCVTCLETDRIRVTGTIWRKSAWSDVCLCYNWNNILTFELMQFFQSSSVYNALLIDFIFLKCAPNCRGMDGGRGPAGIRTFSCRKVSRVAQLYMHKIELECAKLPSFRCSGTLALAFPNLFLWDLKTNQYWASS